MNKPDDRPPVQVDDSSTTSFDDVTPVATPAELTALQERQAKRAAARKEIVATDAEHVTARLEHLADLYNALDVEWGSDPFPKIQALNERSYSDISDIMERFEDTLAELGLPHNADDTQIARKIRSLTRRAERLPEPHLYDSIPLFGYELVTRERIRQITQEGWTEEHDDEHTHHELAVVAALYAVAGIEVPIFDLNDETLNSEQRAATSPLVVWVQATENDAWPDTWSTEYDRREEHDRIRELSIAGALICAEIDRLQRLAMQNERDEKARIRADIDPRADL